MRLHGSDLSPDALASRHLSTWRQPGLWSLSQRPVLPWPGVGAGSPLFTSDQRGLGSSCQRCSCRLDHREQVGGCPRRLAPRDSPSLTCRPLHPGCGRFNPSHPWFSLPQPSLLGSGLRVPSLPQVPRTPTCPLRSVWVGGGRPGTSWRTDCGPSLQNSGPSLPVSHLSLPGIQFLP